MEKNKLKDEIKKLKQEIFQIDTRLTVHKSLQNGSGPILQAPSKETLQNLYDELNHLGLKESKELIRKKTMNSILVCSFLFFNYS
jgi:hypothetical protein